MINDIILNLLLGRITKRDGSIYELVPKLVNGTLEIDIDSDVLDELQNVTIGPNIQSLLSWANQGTVGGGGGTVGASSSVVLKQHQLNSSNGKPKNAFYYPMQFDPTSQTYADDAWNAKNIARNASGMTRTTGPFGSTYGITTWGTSAFYRDTGASGSPFGVWDADKPMNITCAHLLYWPTTPTVTGATLAASTDFSNYRLDIRTSHTNDELMMNQNNFFFGAQLLGTANGVAASAKLTRNKWHIVSYTYDAAVGYAVMYCKPLDGSNPAVLKGEHSVAVPGNQVGKPVGLGIGKLGTGYLDPNAILCDALFVKGEALGAFMDAPDIPTAIGDIANNNWNTFEVGHISHLVPGAFEETFAATTKYAVQSFPSSNNIGAAWIGDPEVGDGVVTQPDSNIISSVTRKSRNLYGSSTATNWWRYVLTGNAGSTFFDVKWHGVTSRIYVEVTVS